MRALEPVTKRPNVTAVSGEWPSCSATTVAQSARTGARFTCIDGSDITSIIVLETVSVERSARNGTEIADSRSPAA
jgi:hypothetical protein